MAVKQIKKKEKVFVAMSGGVDSSVAALLLKKEGYDVVGVFMKNWGEPLGEGERCQWERDQQDARAVAAVLKIPFYTFDFEKDYKKKVADYMLAGYKKGNTPNPDVMCNKEIKFGLFLKRALKLGADYIVTGHYARLRRKIPNSPDSQSESRIRDSVKQNLDKFQIPNFHLFQAKDKNKDQSYFLWTLTQKQLKYCLFPIGDYLKPEVREMAKKAGLPTAGKKDSQGVCFIGKFDFAEFLKKKIKPRKGKIIDVDSGKTIGGHDGVQYYTIGQRHGIGLKGGLGKGGENSPYFVCGKNVKKNILYAAAGENNPALYKKEIKLLGVNLINPNHFPDSREWFRPVSARVRYRQPLASAVLYKLKTGGYKLIFAEPVKFVAPGQSAVFYLKTGETLGGGIIV